MDILKIATAGSVDDGKSTLIGRLLYDTRSITADRLEAVEATSRRKGLDFTDLSLLTDGLIAEREQGITIDVAHIYFATDTRKYIIADTPGHVEYTRNMITGASNAQASLILIDARHGMSEQTRRHLFLSALLRLEQVFVCVNKMDLAAFDEEVYYRICRDVQALAAQIGYAGAIDFIPMVAKDGDNVVHPSSRMPWYEGKPLLQYLEALPVHSRDSRLALRLPVQSVIRPHLDELHDFRGYAGRLVSGALAAGDRVRALPSGQESVVKAVYKGAVSVPGAGAGESVAVELQTDIDLSRGDMLVPAASGEDPVRTTFEARVCWMEETPLTAGRTLLLQHGVNRVKAKVTALRSVLHIGTMEEEEAASLRLNDIARLSIKTARPIFADRYSDHPRNGAFILIDEFTNNTVGAGFIE